MNKANQLIEYGNLNDPKVLDFYKQLSPITHAAKINTPIMVLHGAEDINIPIAHSDKFVEAVRKNGGEVEYLRFPDEGHGLRKKKNLQIAYGRIAPFLESKLGL